MNTNIEITNTENIEQATQYILDENKELVEISKELCKPVEFPISYRLSSAFEVFVRVNGTENYWISNYGRCVNNLNHKDKKTFYEHRTGKRHYTVYEIEKYIGSCPLKQFKNGKIKLDESKIKTVRMLSLNLTEDECNAILEELQSKDEKRKYFIKTTRYQKQTAPELLVAEHFLANRHGTKVWHKDGDEENNWYKNLIKVTPKEYRDLQSGKISYEDLEPKQEYIEYENKSSAAAHKHYGSIRSRCLDTTNKDYIGRCYDNVTMCQEWLDDPKAFVKWYFEHYYEVEGESMAVDKDLFGNGSNMYSPDTCCLLPQTLNNLIVNCKKSYLEGQTADDVLPLGVKKTRDGYSGVITFTGTDDTITLSEWTTPEDAFNEYRIMKQANILYTAARYKNKIPDYIYNKLLTIEVKPY